MHVQFSETIIGPAERCVFDFAVLHLFMVKTQKYFPINELYVVFGNGFFCTISSQRQIEVIVA